MAILPLPSPIPCRRWHEVHWSLGITDTALPLYMQVRGLIAETVYRLPNGGFIIPLPEQENHENKTDSMQ